MLKRLSQYQQIEKKKEITALKWPFNWPIMWT